MKQSIALFILAASVGGCSGKVETRISSSGAPLPVAQPFMISTVAETSPELRQAYKIIASRLATKGFAIAKEAPLHLEITLDARPAALALGSKVNQTDLSPAKKKRLLQSCEDREYRLGVTLTQSVDGTEIYRGRAAEYHCKASVADALPQLVDAALADFGQPRGVYAVTRQGRE